MKELGKAEAGAIMKLLVALGMFVPIAIVALRVPSATDSAAARSSPLRPFVDRRVEARGGDR